MSQLRHISESRVPQIPQSASVMVTSADEGAPEEQSVKKRGSKSSKNKPTVLSSKKPVSRLKPTDLLPNPSRRDPRFDERCGKLNVDLFKKSYSFVTDLQTKERGMISEQLKAATDPDQKARLKLLLSRIEAKEKQESRAHVQQKIRTEHRKREQELVRKGKTPFYLKKGDVKQLELVSKFEELKSQGKLDKFLENRRKHQDSKLRKHLPLERRDAE